MKVSDYILIKITYDHTIKEFDNMINSFNSDETEWYNNLINSSINHLTKKRNIIVEWMWISNTDSDKKISILNKYNFRYKIVNHTETYFNSPEKLPTLREELDKWFNSLINLDFILDRISDVGYDKLSKLEKKYLEKQSKLK
jgi:hypothetical protein